MIKPICSIIFFALVSNVAKAQPYLLEADSIEPKLTEVWQPEPPLVTPGNMGAAPSDAVILFDGKSFDSWEHEDGSTPKWKIEDGAMVAVKGAGYIFSTVPHGDAQIHIEWRTPAEVVGESQGRGNSGVFLQSTYELQVLDSYDNRTYSNGQAGSIYKQTMPLVNASRGPGEWQTYDIIYHAPTFASGREYEKHPYITVFHNGVLIQDHTKIQGTTPYKGPPQVNYHGKLPIKLQDHSNPVAFRNIWLRHL
ncbi:MAG: DUF1080 domain-containing protein [Saprospiraceae bacterium]|nr:DUF1080 domain-containing protein [Saprospiraceae bacterium]